MKANKRDKNKPAKMTWRELIGNAIIDNVTFDMDTDTERFQTIQELIAEWILNWEEKSKFLKYSFFWDYVEKVNTYLYSAIAYVDEECGIPIYIDSPGKNILCISTHPEYMEMRVRNRVREFNLVNNRIQSFRMRIEEGVLI